MPASDFICWVLGISLLWNTISFLKRWVKTRQVGERYPLLCLSGDIGSGKSQVSKYLAQAYGYEEVSFASPIKEIGILMGFKAQEMYGSQAQKEVKSQAWPLSGRGFMRLVGQFIRESPLASEGCSPWTTLAELRIKALLERKTPVVVSDLRLPDEYKMLMGLKAYHIHIKGKRDKAETHITESYQPYFPKDATLNNQFNGLGRLYSEVDSILSEEFL